MLAIIIDKKIGFWNLKNKCVNSKLLKKIYIFMYKYYNFYMNSGIMYNAKFKGEPFLPHGINGIFITENAEIGKNCTIYHQVTIGVNRLPDSKSKGFPKIGDNVYIGAGAKIIGNVNIGNNVRIGANCIVVQDIPDNATVVSSKSIIIESNIKKNNKAYIHINGVWHYFEDSKWIEENDLEAINGLNKTLKLENI